MTDYTPEPLDPVEPAPTPVESDPSAPANPVVEPAPEPGEDIPEPEPEPVPETTKLAEQQAEKNSEPPTPAITDAGVVATVSANPDDKELEIPVDAGPVFQPALINQAVIPVEDTSSNSGYIAPSRNALPYLVQQGSALTLGAGKGPGVAPGTIQGASAGGYIPDFAGNVENEQLPEATDETVKVVEDALNRADPTYRAS